MKKSDVKLAKEVQRWFLESVTFEDEPYVIDLEQAMAVADDNNSTIVAARAGSGKTRTIVAKIIYLVAKCKVKPDEIMVFVFNANAAKEINTRLSEMRVDGEVIIKDVAIASTFHAFSRKVVYDWCDKGDKCKKILAEKKEDFLYQIVKQLMLEERWQQKIKNFLLGGEISDVIEGLWRNQDFVDDELGGLTRKILQFVNRAQQKFLGGGITFGERVEQYLSSQEIDKRERLFIEIGTECYDRYHRYLLENDGLDDYAEYGIDFNLLVAWAGELIQRGCGLTWDNLENKKYLLIDEYQDFSQLFLYVVLAIKNVAKDAKLFVVGDDLQAINRFAGSEVEYFKNFEQYFGNCSRRLVISTNYRCGYEIVNVAHRFMRKVMKEKGSFKAFSRKAGEVNIIDLNMVDLQFAMTNYDKRASEEDKAYKEIAKRIIGHSPKFKTMKYLKVLIELIKRNCLARNILILHRNNEMNVERIDLEKLKNALREGLKRFDVMDEVEFDKRVSVMTMHKSKGLEAEVVIIMEADEGVIPRMHPDTELFSIFGENNEVALADQKRLFYVAITRAKRKLYIIYDSSIKGGFVRLLGRGLKNGVGS